jgi:hypothetical protein
MRKLSTCQLTKHTKARQCHGGGPASAEAEPPRRRPRPKARAEPKAEPNKAKPKPKPVAAVSESKSKKVTKSAGVDEHSFKCGERRGARPSAERRELLHRVVERCGCETDGADWDPKTGGDFSVFVYCPSRQAAQRCAFSLLMSGFSCHSAHRTSEAA